MSPRDPDAPPWQAALDTDEPCLGPDEGAGEDGPWAAGWGDRVGTDLAFVAEMQERSKRDHHGIVGSDIRKLVGMYLALAAKLELGLAEIAEGRLKAAMERYMAAMELPRSALPLDEIEEPPLGSAARLDNMLAEMDRVMKADIEAAKNLPSGGLVSREKRLKAQAIRDSHRDAKTGPV